MAARSRNYQTQKTRDKIRDTIKTRKVVEKLQAHLFGEDGKKVELKGTQIKAAEILLNRTMPVLSKDETDQPEERGPEQIKEQLQSILNNLDDKTKEQLQLLLEEPCQKDPGDQTPKQPSNTVNTSLNNKPTDVSH